MGIAPPASDASVSYMISSCAREHRVWIIGGSIPELDDSTSPPKVFNTSIVCDPSGIIVGKYRKLHLFDVCIPPDESINRRGISFKESETLSPGNIGPGIVGTPWGFDIGVGICYDIRFPEYAAMLRQRSSDRMKLLVYPGAFNTTTGPLHWEILGRARAVDTQSFCVLASTARSQDPGDYQVCSPIILSTDPTLSIVLGSFDDHFAQRQDISPT